MSKWRKRGTALLAAAGVFAGSAVVAAAEGHQVRAAYGQSVEALRGDTATQNHSELGPNGFGADVLTGVISWIDHAQGKDPLEDPRLVGTKHVGKTDPVSLPKPSEHKS